MTRKLIRTTFCILALICITSTAALTQTKKTRAISRGERLITALVNSKTIPGLFGDDGFFHSVELSPDVIRIFKLGRRAIPLLIKHLDDWRVFKHMLFYGNINGPEKVTAGEGLLELLTDMIK